MEHLQTIAQVVVALGLLNVWLFRFSKVSPYRAGTAKNMKEEFAAYGLPSWSVFVVGGLKVLFALCLLAGFWVAPLIRPAAIGVAVLMVGAIAMHIKVSDTLVKSAPAAIMLVLSLLVAMG